MSESWGGARTPAAPAAVSGPGALSARTDGGVMDPNSPSYGEVADVQSLQQAAPLAGPSGAAAQGGAPGGNPLAALMGLGAPGSGGLPVTAGASAGAGPGPEALGLPGDALSEDKADAQSLSPATINALLAEASRPTATPSFKRLVRSVVPNL